jgi:hypothetical protein
MEERKTGIEDEKKDIMTTMINVNIAREADCSMLNARCASGCSSLVNFESMLAVYTLDISAMDDGVVVVVRRKTKKRRSQRTTVRVYLTSAAACTKKKEEKTRTIPNATLILRIHTIPLFFLRYYPADDLMLHIEKLRSHQRMQE